MVIDVNSPLAIIHFLSNNKKFIAHLSRLKKYNYIQGQNQHFTAPSARSLGYTSAYTVSQHYKEIVRAQGQLNPFFERFFQDPDLEDHSDYPNDETEDDDDEGDDDTNAYIDYHVEPSPLLSSLEALNTDSPIKSVSFQDPLTSLSQIHSFHTDSPPNQSSQTDKDPDSEDSEQLEQPTHPAEGILADDDDQGQFNLYDQDTPDDDEHPQIPPDDQNTTDDDQDSQNEDQAPGQSTPPQGRPHRNIRLPARYDPSIFELGSP